MPPIAAASVVHGRTPRHRLPGAAGAVAEEVAAAAAVAASSPPPPRWEGRARVIDISAQFIKDSIREK